MPTCHGPLEAPRGPRPPLKTTAIKHMTSVSWGNGLSYDFWSSENILNIAYTETETYYRIP